MYYKRPGVALPIAIVAFLTTIPALVIAILAFTRAPPVVNDLTSQFLQLQNTLDSVVSMVSNNVTKTPITSGVCYLEDDNAVEFTTTFEAYSLDFDMGDLATIILEVRAFSAPVSALNVDLYCRADIPDLNWNRIVSPINSYRIFSAPMLANFTFVGSVRTYVAQDESLGYPNYFINSPVSIPSQPGFFDIGRNLRLSWKWNIDQPWTYGVDFFNFNGVMKFGLASSYPLGNSKKK